MTLRERIDCMITTLKMVKEEVDYAELYQKDETNYNGRFPSGTVIRESLKMVSRMANIIAKDVTLTPYCNEIYKKK